MMPCHPPNALASWYEAAAGPPREDVVAVYRPTRCKASTRSESHPHRGQPPMDTIGVDLHKRESKLYILAPDRTATPTRKTYTQVDLIGESLRRARILVASSSSLASVGAGMATASTITGPLSR